MIRPVSAAHQPALRLVILDMDGVLYRGEEPVPGAVALVQRLHGAGLLVRYATNNSMFTRSAYVSRLAGMGLRAEMTEIVTSTSATIEHLGRHEADVQSVLALGADGMVDELRTAGYQVTSIGEAVDRGGAPRVDAVLVGLDPLFDVQRLGAAVKAVQAGALFVATNADARYPTPEGYRPGAGTMVAAIKAKSGVEPLVIGKPEPAMFRSVLEATGVAAAEALVVGDNPDSDIAGARRSGVESVLVLTGVTSAEAASRLVGETQPDHVAADPAAVWALIEKRLG
jgi:4-nitrophenyl phosphatase